MGGIARYRVLLTLGLLATVFCDTLDLPSVTQTGYQKSPAECYGSIKPRSKVALTNLLPEEVRLTAHGLDNMLRSLKNVIAHTPSDVLMFHTSSWTADHIKGYLPEDAWVQVVCIATSDWVAPKKLEAWEHVHYPGKGGYKSMCRWYSRQVFNVLHSAGYEWVIRVDTDSAFPAPIQYNLIDTLVARNAEYGFRVMIPEPPHVLVGLAEAARYWVEVEEVQPTFLYKHCNPKTSQGISINGWDKLMIYNNFYVTKLSFWMQPKVQAWLKFLEHTNGHYKFRWGDAPVHTLTLEMFMPEKKIVEFTFPYVHNGGWQADQCTSCSKMPDIVHLHHNVSKGDIKSG